MAIGKTNATTIIGGGTTTGDYLVRYIDLDGTVLKEQWVNSGQNATPPTDPNYDSSYLTFSAWSKSSTNITNHKDIGALYTTLNNKTYAFITLTTSSGLSPTLYLNKSDGSTLTVEWGDGTQSTFTNSGNFNTGSHTYSVIGEYIISMYISSGSGTYTFGSGSASTAFITNKSVLKYIYIGSSVTNINNYAFYSCASLKYIAIPISISSIGETSFNNCYSLQSIIIPDQVSNIGSYAFYNAYSLRYFVAPNSITTISDGVFYNCFSLQSVVIPSSVASIGSSAFYSCNSLTFIITPSSLTSIGANAFYGCDSLQSVVIPNSVTSIGDGAFYRCYSLYNIIVPSSVTSIGANAFYNCFSIIQYKVYKTSTPTTLSNTNAFTGINVICKIYVPTDELQTYKTATNWIIYANYIYPLSDLGE